MRLILFLAVPSGLPTVADLTQSRLVEGKEICWKDYDPEAHRNLGLKKVFVVGEHKPRTWIGAPTERQRYLLGVAAFVSGFPSPW
jgi:hypothetical protein